MNYHLANNSPYNKANIDIYLNENQYTPYYSQRKSRSIEREIQTNENSNNILMNDFHKNQNPNNRTFYNNKIKAKNKQYKNINSINPVFTSKVNRIYQSERNINKISKYPQKYTRNNYGIVMNNTNGENIIEESPQDSDLNINEHINSPIRKKITMQNNNFIYKKALKTQNNFKKKNEIIKGQEKGALKEDQLAFENKRIPIQNEYENIREEFEKYVIKYKKLEEENFKLKAIIEELQREIKNVKIKYENLIKRIKRNNIMQLYSSPTLIGLNNIGATCFMNSTLQCLSQTKQLTSYFLNEKNFERIMNNNIANSNENEYQLSPVYFELLEKLWEIDGEKSFSPYKFMNTVNNMNPLFKTGQAGDAKDFIIFVLEQLHKELKQPIKTINNNNFNKNQPLNQYDKNNSFNYFFNDFKKDCSIISDLFFGFNETTNECLNCKNKFNSQGMNSPICYNYGIFNCLIFPLEEVKIMKNQLMKSNYKQTYNNIVTIYDCFYYNQKTELFTGQNRNYCNICKQSFDSNYCSKIYISPNILILILNRGKGNMYDVKLEFNEIIDITQFVLRNDYSQLIYNLYGVITHIGQSGPNAHFIASCKSPIDNKWYRYNDSIVNPIENLQKEIIDFGTPYILFYHK